MHRRRNLLLCTLLGLAGMACATAVAAARVDDANDPFQHTRRMLEQHPNATYDPEAILVRFVAGTTQVQRDAIRAIVGGEKLQEWTLVPDLEQVKVKGDVKAAMATLNATPGVVYAELDWFVHTCATPNDPSFGLLWGLNNTGQTVNADPGIAGADINGPEAWDITTGSSTFVVADIDSGVNYNHPDLAANMWSNTVEVNGVAGVDDDGNGYIDDIRGWNFVSNTNNPMDDNGHGTHTSGTIGAVGNNGVGVTGVMWSCRIMALKFLNSAGSGAISGALSALQYATQKGVKVSNNSWGGGGFSASFQTAINNSQSVGHIFVAAAGNSSTNNDATPSYPSSYTSGNIIAVVATNNNDGFASFSSYGATSCDIGAPGVNILSTYNSGYAYLDGTSMATPHVAGVVGLVYVRNPSWTWSQVRTQVLGTARVVSSLTGRCATRGVVNAAAAVGGTAPPPPPPPPPPPAPANNACASAQPVVYGVTSFNTTNSTTDGPAACGAIANDVWFRHTACATGVITVQTCSLATWDTVLVAYSGSCGALTQLACNDDVCSTQSRITFNATSGQTYLIRLGGYNGATGSGSISLSGPSCAPAGPVNNACLSATVIGNGSFAGTTSGATRDGTSTCGATTNSPDVWYSYTATCTGVLTVDTCTAASFDTVLSVHTGCPGTTSNQLNCNDDAPAGRACAGTLRSYLNVNVTAGTNYKIRVSGYNGASGTFTMRVACGIGPASDDCQCDWNDDGVVNSSDFFAFIDAYMNGGGDFNASGEINTQDFFDFLTCFFGPPEGCGQ